MKRFGTWGENDRKKTKKEKKREKGQIWKWRTRAFSYLILFRFSRENKGKGEEKSGELSFCIAQFVFKRGGKVRVPRAWVIPFFFVSFSYVFHEYSITSCIPMLPPLSLIHFINEEIILVDDLLFLLFHLVYLMVLFV